jgi:hypothetical protein
VPSVPIDRLGLLPSLNSCYLSQFGVTMQHKYAMRLIDLIETVNTESLGFNLWFSGSKVVDDDDKPLVCFHGTHAPHEIKPAGHQHFGTFAAANDRIADVYRDIALGAHAIYPRGHASTTSVYPVYLSISNPILLPDCDDWHDADVITNLYQQGLIDLDVVHDFENGESTETWLDLVKRLGYDGVMYQNEYEDHGSMSWYPFADHQVWNIFADKHY